MLAGTFLSFGICGGNPAEVMASGHQITPGTTFCHFVVCKPPLGLNPQPSLASSPVNLDFAPLSPSPFTMSTQDLEKTQPSTGDMTSGNRSDENATTDTHGQGERSKPGATWKQNEVHEVPHKQVSFALNLRTMILNFVQ